MPQRRSNIFKHKDKNKSKKHHRWSCTSPMTTKSPNYSNRQAVTTQRGNKSPGFFFYIEIIFTLIRDEEQTFRGQRRGREGRRRGRKRRRVSHA